MSITITLSIIILTGLISYRAFNDPSVFHSLKHYPIAERQNSEYYRMLSSGFVHGSWLHLLINLYVLYIFGEYVEQYYMNEFGSLWGKIIFLLVYLSTIIVADLPTYFRHYNNPNFAAIGASGAVSGILFIFILLNPWEMLLIYFVIPMPAIIAGVAYLAYSSWASKNSRDNIDHSAHFYGAIYGMVVSVILNPDLLGIFARQFLSKF